MSNIQIEVGKKYRDRLGNFYLIDREEKKFKGKFGWPVWSGKKAWWNNGSSYENQVNDTDLIEEVKENEMKIEVGKYYKTRDGRKAFVAFCTPSPCLIGPYVGYVETETNLIYNWLGDGAASMRASSNNKYDLIEEWKEPKSGVKYFNVYPECVDVSAYKDRAEANKHKDNDRIACVRVEWKEGQFDD